MKKFSINTDETPRDLDKYWELCVGSCHAATALRADWQEQMRKCHMELGFRYVRFHGLFDDDMNVAFKPIPIPNAPIRLNFTYIDVIYDFLLSINMKPFVELGFMPQVLASGNNTVFHYKGNTTPPRDYEQWGWLIGEFIKHLLNRYGRDEIRSWFFEVWNEPNLGGKDSPAAFWAAEKEDYFHLYEVTANAIKEQDPMLKVGGPATSNNAWIPDIISFCTEKDVPLDFISTHQYPTDIAVGYGMEDSKTFSNPLKKLSDPAERAKIMGNPQAVIAFFQEMSIYKKDIWKMVERGVLTDMIKRAHSESGNLPIYYTEWGSLAGIESDGPFGSSFIMKTVLDSVGLVQGYSFWTFSDIFEEQGQQSAAFHGGFGLLTQHGIPKAPYRAFQLLHQLGSELYSVQNDGTVDFYHVFKKKTNVLQLVLINHNSLQHAISDENICIQLPANLKVVAADVQRVDLAHANAFAVWQQMGSPEYLNTAQKAQLLAASELVCEPVSIEDDFTIQLDLPVQGIALVSVYLS